MKELIDRVIPQINVSSFSLEKELKLKSMIIAYLIMTRNNKYLDDLIAVLIAKLKDDDHFRTNGDEYFNIVLEEAYKHYSKEEIINNYLIDGYLYHSFNGAFLASIKNRGLILNNKPWDLNETEQVKKIFSSHGKKDIYGMYQGEEKTPIYLANNLISSSYYALSSPTWFLHFTTGGMQDKECDKETFRNRDYSGCLKNILKIMHKYHLSKEEQDVVLVFFDKYYNYLGVNKSPKVLLIKRKIINPINDLELQEKGEQDIDYLKRIFRLHLSGNLMIKHNIKKEDILIIDYLKERKYEL